MLQPVAHEKKSCSSDKFAINAPYLFSRQSEQLNVLAARELEEFLMGFV